MTKPSYPCLCLRCGYAWQSAKREGPAGCPVCHSQFWDVPRVGQGHSLHEH
jgi:predicted Zn-ribbon and HTH transcriptional regulator